MFRQEDATLVALKEKLDPDRVGFSFNQFDMVGFSFFFKKKKYCSDLATCQPFFSYSFFMTSVLAHEI